LCSQSWLCNSPAIAAQPGVWPVADKQHVPAAQGMQNRQITVFAMPVGVPQHLSGVNFTVSGLVQGDMSGLAVNTAVDNVAVQTAGGR